MDNLMPRKNIAIVFFGITRSLRHTIDSIEKNVFVPTRQVANLSVYAHFFDVDNVNNTRSGEGSCVDPDEYKLLNANWVQLSDPNSILEASGFNEIKSFGDHWDDGFKSASNLIHQLYSMKVVTLRALEDHPDIIIYCRPDLQYHDSLRNSLRLALAVDDPLIFIPFWQRHKGGMNDRFSICVGEKAAKAYGQRLDLAIPFCRNTNLELHSERLLRYSVAKSGIPVQKLNVRASRVRADGRIVKEDFSTRSWKMLRNYFRFRGKLGL